MNSILKAVVIFSVLLNNIFSVCYADMPQADQAITKTAKEATPLPIPPRDAAKAPLDVDTKTAESAENLQTQALGYFYAGDKVKALAVMDEAVKQFPDDATNYQLRGTFYGEMQNFPLAIVDLQRATELDPSSADAWTNLGGVLLSNGDFAAAQSASAKAFDLTPSYIAAANLGHTYLLQGDGTTARLWYHKSMRLLPNETALRTGPLVDFDWFISHNWQQDISRAEQAWYAKEAMAVLSQGVQAEEARVAVAEQRMIEKEAKFVRESTAETSELNAKLSNIQNLEKSLGRKNAQVIMGYQFLSQQFKYQAYSYTLGQYYVEAEPLFKQALTIGIQAFGDNHVEVADILRKMASLYKDQKRYADASKLFARALMIEERNLGGSRWVISSVMARAEVG